MSRVTALTGDLLFGSRVKAMLEAEGHEVVVVTRAEAVVAGDVVVVDLAGDHVRAAEAKAAAGAAKTLAVYSHVDTDTKREAEAAGFDLVVPRSRMAREGAALVGRLAAGSNPA